MAFVGAYQIYTIVTSELVTRVSDWGKLAISINAGLGTLADSVNTAIIAARAGAVTDAATYTDSNATALGVRIDNADNKNTAQDTRLDAVESKNTDQDARLDGRVLLSSADFHAITENGLHKMQAFPVDWAAQNMPVNIRGTLWVEPFGTGRILFYKTYETVPRVFVQTSISGTWGAWKDLEGSAAAVAVRVTDLEASRDSKLLANETDFYTVSSGGNYKVTYFSTDYGARHMPVPTRGVLSVLPMATTNRVITYTTYEASPKIFVAACVSGVWGPWREIGSEATSGGKVIASDSQDFHAITESGTHMMLGFATDWAGQNMPVNARGALSVQMLNSMNRLLEYNTYELVPRKFQQNLVSGVWGQWKDMAPAATTTAPAVTPGSGLKVVPLQLTLGSASQTDGALTGSRRYLMKWNAPLQRVRVNIQNIHPSSGTVKTGAVDFTGLWIGKHASNGAFTGAPTQVQGAFSTPTDGSKWTSKWFWLNQTAGVEDLLSFGYTASNGTVFQIGGSGWKTDAPADASATNPAGLTADGSMPFYIWLEAETYATTPHLAAMLTSLDSGVGAGGVNFSWLSQYCWANGALPTHYSNSGDTYESWVGDLNAYKWTVFDGLAKPDALVMAAPSNDLAGSKTLAEIQAFYATLAAQVKSRITPNLYVANCMPRTADAVDFTTKRQGYNSWLTGLPGGAREMFNFRDAASADDATIRPEFDADGVHLNSAGYAALAAAITRPITTPPVMYAI